MRKAGPMTTGRTLISGGTVVSGGSLVRDATVIVDGSRIAAVIPAGVGEVDTSARAEFDRMLDARGCFVLPGIINGHAHGCTTGPLFSSAAAALDERQVLANLDRHLAAGVTTLVNVCGFATFADVPAHDIDIRLGTTHLPSAVVAAGIVDGAGLDDSHRATTAEKMLHEGAVALGEIGSGATLGGGVAAYRYLPDALEVPLGRRIDAGTATQLIDALVGPTRTATPDDAGLRQALVDVALPTSIHGAAREAILRYASSPVHESLDSFAEALVLAERHERPAVFHVAAPSAPRLLELARESRARVVAGHVNHPSFTADEAVRWARAFRDVGAVVDVSSLDVVHAQRLASPDIADALASEGLVDTLSTDYAGGGWEPMLALVQRWTRAGYVELAEGIAMCTSAPAEVFGFTDRGRVEAGLRADVVLVEEDDLERVRTVIANGRVRVFT